MSSSKSTSVESRVRSALRRRGISLRRRAAGYFMIVEGKDVIETPIDIIEAAFQLDLIAPNEEVSFPMFVEAPRGVFRFNDHHRRAVITRCRRSADVTAVAS